MKLPERWSGLYTVTAGSKLINSASHKHVQSQVRLRGTAGFEALENLSEEVRVEKAGGYCLAHNDMARLFSRATSRATIGHTMTTTMTMTLREVDIDAGTKTYLQLYIPFHFEKNWKP